MAETATARTKRWFERITVAEKIRDQWEQRFQPKKLQAYWEGFQWGDASEEQQREKYTINLVYASIEAQKPSLLFHRPVVKITPRPGKADDYQSTIVEQAQLCQDTVQTFLSDRDVQFTGETTLALQEAYFRYGVVEVGYTADWVDNPNAGKPVLKGDVSGDDPVLDEDRTPVKQPARLLKGERLFVKRIPASDFLVSASSANVLHRNDWVGYSEWHYLEDVKRHPDFSNTTNLKTTGLLSEKLREGTVLSKDELERRHGMVRLWKLWDLREKKRYVLAEGHPKPLLDGTPFTVFPFAVLKFHERLNDFYPLPPVFNWKAPQDEINETREMQRVHRRRFTRRYVFRKGSMDVSELEKLESGEDGVYAEHLGAPGEQPLVPVPDAPLDGAVWNNLAAGKEDFGQVSGITGEQRGVPQSSTATQANIINQNAQIRENAARLRVAEWLADVCRIILETVRAKMALPFLIQRHVDLKSPSAMEELVRVAGLWQEITAEDLGALDMDVALDLASLSPITQDAQKASWDEMLAKMTNPEILALIAQSPELLRTTLHLAGIRNETQIRAIEESLQARFMQQQMAMLAQAGTASAPKAAGEPSPPSDVMPQAGVPAGTGSLE
jgi:hypothetical protein